MSSTLQHRVKHNDFRRTSSLLKQIVKFYDITTVKQEKRVLQKRGIEEEGDNYRTGGRETSFRVFPYS